MNEHEFGSKVFNMTRDYAQKTEDPIRVALNIFASLSANMLSCIAIYSEGHECYKNESPEKIFRLVLDAYVERIVDISDETFQQLQKDKK